MGSLVDTSGDNITLCNNLIISWFDPYNVILFSGAILNLNQLRIINGKPWTVEDGENHLYEFNICGAVTDSACHNASALMGKDFFISVV